MGARQVMVYDPKTKQFTNIDTCFDADHNHFAENAESTLYFGQNNTLGWVDTAAWDKTKNAEASQGWCPAVIDTTGDGKITQWTEPEQPPERTHVAPTGVRADTGSGSTTRPSSRATTWAPARAWASAASKVRGTISKRSVPLRTGRPSL